MITPSDFVIPLRKKTYLVKEKILKFFNFKYLLRVITHESHFLWSVDEIYWHSLFFLKVQKKRRIVARVQCRNIKNECPKPTCEEPILLPGRCCKTCPGDSHSKLLLPRRAPYLTWNKWNCDLEIENFKINFLPRHVWGWKLFKQTFLNRDLNLNLIFGKFLVDLEKNRF